MVQFCLNFILQPPIWFMIQIISACYELHNHVILSLTCLIPLSLKKMDELSGQFLLLVTSKGGQIDLARDLVLKMIEFCAWSVLCCMATFLAWCFKVQLSSIRMSRRIKQSRDIIVCLILCVKTRRWNAACIMFVHLLYWLLLSDRKVTCQTLVLHLLEESGGR